MEGTRYLISDAAAKVSVEAHVLRYWEEELGLPISRTELGHRYYTEEDIRCFQNIKELKERGFQLKAIKVLLPELKKREMKDPGEAMAHLEKKLAEKNAVGAENPAGVGRLAGAENPVGAGGPAGAEKPAGAGRLAGAENPVGAGRLAGAENPAETGRLAGAENPDDGERSADGGNPADAEKPAGAGNSADTEKSAGAGNPVDTEDTAGRSEADPEQILRGKDSKELVSLGVDLDRLAGFESIMENVFRQTLQDNNQELEDRISDSVLKGMDVLMQLKEEKEEARYRQLDESIREHQKKKKLVAASRERTEGEPRRKRFFFF